MSEPIPAWGNLLRHAEGRLESESQGNRSTWSRRPFVDGTCGMEALGNFRRPSRRTILGFRDNINAWNFELIRWGNCAC